MDAIIGALMTGGYWGLLVAAFLAGSIIPFPSEAAFVGLQAIGLDPWKLVVFGTIGNVLGGMFNYGLGRMGKVEWIERILRIKRESLDKAMRFMEGRGAWMGLFAVLPFLGGPITVAMGLMRANVAISVLSMTIGKSVRYILLMYGVGQLM
jgi:membrane protein YqaA with SNARE-associated domain